MTDYFRPLAQSGPARPDDALTLVGGRCWFTHAQHITRDQAGQIIPASQVPEAWLSRLCGARADVAGLDMSGPRVMGILNVTPDSFSDGGAYLDPDVAITHARAMGAAGADIIDIGGESTRPGAAFVPEDEEVRRTAPVINALRAAIQTPISIDTRKTSVAQAAVAAGADLVNDVSGFTFDPALAPFCVGEGVPVCLMHAQGDPATMQKNPHYDDVLLDVYDFLEERVSALEMMGLARSKITVDPGIGFGKTLAHNLTLLNGISLFHGLGCPVLLGASRKRFIGTIGHAPEAQDRASGSVAVALAAAAQGVQLIRVHDVAETRQALALWLAVESGEYNES